MAVAKALLYLGGLVAFSTMVAAVTITPFVALVHALSRAAP